MTAGDSSAKLRPSRRELRRSGRVALSVPVEVSWRTSDDTVVRESTESLEVSNHGAILRMKTHPPPHSQLELINRFSNEVAQAQVVGRRPSSPDGVAVEMLVPSETFWGITFRLKKAAGDLRNLEEDLKAGGADPQVLRDFRDAVDYVRKTAWAVHEWQERQYRHKDAATVLSLLATERVRRATQLTEAVVADLGAQKLTSDTPGMRDFIKAIERISEQLKSTHNS